MEQEHTVKHQQAAVQHQAKEPAQHKAEPLLKPVTVQNGGTNALKDGAVPRQFAANDPSYTSAADEATATAASKPSDDDKAKSDAQAKLEKNFAEGDKQKKPFKSWGQRIHNEITYRGVDWILNASFGVGFAYFTERTAAGSKFWGKNIRDGFFEKVLRPIFKEGAELYNAKTWAARFLAIMFGGTITIPPIMALENKENKKSIIRSLDNKIYGKEVVENDPKFQESYDAIEQEPEKNFGLGLITRFISLAPIFAVALPDKTANFLDKQLYQRIAKITKWAAHHIGIRPKQDSWLIKGGAEGLPFKGIPSPENKNNWEYIHHTIGFDFGLSIIYAVLHEFSYKAGSAIWGDRKKAKEQQGAQHGMAANETEQKPEEKEMAKMQHEELVEGRHQEQPKKEEIPQSKVHKVQSLARQEVAEQFAAQGV